MIKSEIMVIVAAVIGSLAWLATVRFRLDVEIIASPDLMVPSTWTNPSGSSVLSENV